MKKGERSDKETKDETGDEWFETKQRLQKSSTFDLIDLTSDDVVAAPSSHRLTYTELFALDRCSDSGAISQSQSSSVSSLDNVLTARESISTLTFSDTCTKKSDSSSSPSLWVGTSVGSIVVVSFLLPDDNESRLAEQVLVALSGTVFKLKGVIKTISFLDFNGILPAPLTSLVDQSRDMTRDDSHIKEKKPYYRQQSVANLKTRLSPTTADETTPLDHQFAIVCSEKQARVIALPSQTCTFKVKVTETSSVAKADVITIRDYPVLACFLHNGHIMTFSLPTLRPLLDCDHVPSPEPRVTQTFCFSLNCHALYFCSPSEIQKLTLSAEVSESLSEMAGELFLPSDMPEAPKQGFLKTLFNVGTASDIDREELFGESSGKAAKGIAKYTGGMAQAQDNANVAVSDISRARQLAMERGEKLGDLDERTERMRNEAEMYAHNANMLKNKMKDKKWYQF